MLKKLKVKNFRNFEDWFILDLSTKKNYEFNQHLIHNGMIEHSILFGLNGSGKTNLGLAIVDLLSHLKIDDLTIPITLSENYLNANSSSNIAEFSYTFQFDNDTVIYNYGKTERDSVVYEELLINNEIVVSLDRRKEGLAHFTLEGTENLKSDLSKIKISAVKYLRSNSALEENKTNAIFDKFLAFVDGMIFFRTLAKSEFYGTKLETKRLSSEIIKRNKVLDFETFLNTAGVDCVLEVTESLSDEEKYIEVKFKNKSMEFSKVASTGTLSLGYFFYWWMRMEAKEFTFAYIDEFDAYYHFDLARIIVEMLNKTECQTILTSHNITLMSNDLMRPDCYFHLDKTGQKPLSDLISKELRKAHNLEKIYKSLI